MKLWSGILAWCLLRKRREKTVKAMHESRIKIATARLVFPSDEPASVDLNEVNMAILMKKKDCIMARISELNMSLPRANMATF